MGNNQAFTIMEMTVIGVADAGLLNETLCRVLCEPYRGSDIDSGGCCGLKTKDGRGIEQVIIEAMGRVMPEKPTMKEPKKWSDSPENRAWDAYGEAVYAAFHDITYNVFGWR